MDNKQKRWCKTFTPRPQAQSRLFCLPCAGAGASMYRRSCQQFDKEIEVCAVQLPGREDRLTEKPYHTMASLVEDMATSICPLLDRPFAIFGHSMGALIALEWALWLRRHGVPTQPLRLIVSAQRPPDAPQATSLRYDLPEPQFKSALRALNGTPSEVLADEELMEMILPVLRADLEVCQTYHTLAEEPLGIPIDAFAGIEDREAAPDTMRTWARYTTGPFTMQSFPGDHFYLHDSANAVPKVLSELLLETSRGHTCCISDALR